MGRTSLMLTAGEARHVDGICQGCRLPTLFDQSMYALGTDGPALRATILFCGECGAWVYAPRT